MGLKDDITQQVDEYLSGDYDIDEIDYIPEVGDVTFGNQGLKIKATILYIDNRRSTEILDTHRRQTVAKIHKSFLYTASKIAVANNGCIRSFSGDSILAFWMGNYKHEISQTVKAAMQMKYMLSKVLGGRFRKYDEVDFGIGIDWGEILVVKSGLKRDPNNNDLVWIGTPVNFAVRLGDSASSPNHIKISEDVYNNLEDYVKYGNKKNFLGQNEQVDMWEEENNFEFAGNYYTIYSTDWYWKEV